MPHRPVMRGTSVPHGGLGASGFANQALAKAGGPLAVLETRRFPFGVTRMKNLPAAVRRFAEPNAKIAQLILRFAEKLHHRSLTLLFHEGRRCRTGRFGEPARSTSLPLRAIIWPRALF